ncbi:MAG: PqqD family protein [Ardenticatenaceae bacterium]|nr:PqqD family protein [Anaerolineales bacterium]MCB8916885.1 PqqD family protein [Ardenticatenaceae bacterium]
MTSQLIPAPPAGVISRRLDNETILVSPDAGKIRVLNEVGSHIWQLINGQNNVAAIEAALTAHYNVAPEQVRQDVRAFLDDLTRRGLLEWQTVNTA